MGAVGALLLAIIKRRLDWTLLRTSVESTALLSTFVMFLLIGARVFGLTFYGVNGNIWIEELLLALPGGEYGFLLVVALIVFILGCFLDFFEIAFILVPLLAPVASKLGIDLIWFGVILGVNLQTSFLTPPFGFSLFYLRSVAPDKEWFDKRTNTTLPGIKTSTIYKGALPFIGIQALTMFLVIAFPGLVMHYRSPPPALPQLERPSPGNTSGPLGLPPLGLPGSSPFGGPPQGGSSTPKGLGPGLPPGLGGPAPSSKSPPPGLGGTPPPGLGGTPPPGLGGTPPAGLGTSPPPGLGGGTSPAPAKPQPAAPAPSNTNDLSKPPSFN